MTLKLRCPACGEGEKSEVIQVLSERKYLMKCADCGGTYVVAAGGDERTPCEKTGSSRSCE